MSGIFFSCQGKGGVILNYQVQNRMIRRIPMVTFDAQPVTIGRFVRKNILR
jgi:hypothetical protein